LTLNLIYVFSISRLKLLIPPRAFFFFFFFFLSLSLSFQVKAPEILQPDQLIQSKPTQDTYSINLAGDLFQFRNDDFNRQRGVKREDKVVAVAAAGPFIYLFISIYHYYYYYCYYYVTIILFIIINTVTTLTIITIIIMTPFSLKSGTMQYDYKYY
jgi:hypothetical protein